MLNLTSLAVDALSARLVGAYRHVFGRREPDHAATIAAAVRLTLGRIGTSDAPYHDIGHTAMVALVGTEILRGREIAERVTPEDWLHTTVALLCHDVGYVRGACRGDTATEAVVGEGGARRVALPRGASDAWLTPHHVDRGKVFVHERAEVLGPAVDPGRVARAIELTRFPVPEDGDHAETGTEAGLVRAADLIGQLADPDYLRKQTALFHEFEETGIARRLGYTSAADLGEDYVRFFWEKVEPYIGDGLRYLQLTPEGRQWIANLYAQVFTVEHRRWRMGPQPGVATKPAPPA
jgi:hypothetical protein